MAPHLTSQNASATVLRMVRYAMRTAKKTASTETAIASACVPSAASLRQTNTYASRDPSPMMEVEGFARGRHHVGAQGDQQVLPAGL